MTAPLDPAAQRLVLDHQGYARKAARFYARRLRGTLAGDVVSKVVQEALVDAARTFEPARGVSFPSYVWLRVSAAISEATRVTSAEPASVRENLAACLDLQDGEIDLDATETGVVQRTRAMVARAAISAVLEPRSAPVVAAPAPRSEGPLVTAVVAAIAHLPERSRRLVDLYYGEQRTLHDVAAELGMSFGAARRCHDEAIDRIRAACQSADSVPPG